MRKQLAVLAAMGLAAGMITGCGSGKTTETQAPGTTAAVQAASSEETKTEAASSAEETTAPKPERAKIKIAYHPHITGVGGILNAIDNGYFEDENLEVELVQFTSGATELAAMASGDIDIGYLGVGAHVFAPQGQCAILTLDSTDLSGEIMGKSRTAASSP